MTVIEDDANPADVLSSPVQSVGNTNMLRRGVNQTGITCSLQKQLRWERDIYESSMENDIMDQSPSAHMEDITMEKKEEDEVHGKEDVYAQEEQADNDKRASRGNKKQKLN